MLTEVDVAFSIACHLLATLNLQLLRILNLLNLLNVLLDLLIHVKQVELVDVRGVQAVLCLQLLRVLQVNCLVILLVTALTSTLPLLLRCSQATSHVGSRIRKCTSLVNQMGPGTALLVGGLSVCHDSSTSRTTFLEPSASNFDNRLRSLTTVGTVNDDVVGSG